MRKALLIIIAVLVCAILAAYLFLNKKLPEGSDPQKADQWATHMLDAVNDSAWQATGAVSWNFMGNHDHLWDRTRNLARVRWGDYEVFVNLDSITGIAFQDGAPVSEKKDRELVQKAWKYWVNDAFWLNPVSKVFDPGTERSIVKFKDGREGLRVTYTRGGNTPGDSYVWMLDESYRPYAWKMWVSIIPVGGLEIPWSKWDTTETGAIICTLHDSFIDLKLEDVHTAADLNELTGGMDPFEVMF